VGIGLSERKGSGGEKIFLGDECAKLLEMGKRIMVGPTVLSTLFTMREQDLLEIALGTYI
jgi:hypothetical protein